MYNQNFAVRNTIYVEECLTTLIVKISIPKVKTVVLKNILIFDHNNSHKASICLIGERGGGAERYSTEFYLKMHFPYVGLPSPTPPHTKKGITWLEKQKR